jgi:hypothetical protein
VTILLGLVLLFAALAVAVIGAVTSTTGSTTVPGDVTILGVHAQVLPGGNLFLFGIEVGIVGMIGLRLIHGDVGRRLATRRLGRQRMSLKEETRAVERDRDRLARELLRQRAGLATDALDDLAVLVAPQPDRGTPLGGTKETP